MLFIIYEDIKLGFSQGILKGGSITVPLPGLDYSALQIKTKIVSCHTADSNPVKQEVNGRVILPPFSIPCSSPQFFHQNFIFYFVYFFNTAPYRL
jgi:hypothetical protein